MCRKMGVPDLRVPDSEFISKLTTRNTTCHLYLRVIVPFYWFTVRENLREPPVIKTRCVIAL